MSADISSYNFGFILIFSESFLDVLDILRAFERVNQAPLAGLHSYGVPILISWVLSYSLRLERVASGRGGRSRVGHSLTIALMLGVPQGSTLAPIIFLLHLTYLFSTKNHTHLNADVTILYRCFLPPFRSPYCLSTLISKTSTVTDTLTFQKLVSQKFKRQPFLRNKLRFQQLFALQSIQVAPSGHISHPRDHPIRAVLIPG